MTYAPNAICVRRFFEPWTRERDILKAEGRCGVCFMEETAAVKY